MRSGSTTRKSQRATARGGLAATLLAGVLVLGLPLGASANEAEYDAPDAGNPVRITAYVLHPIGVIYDYLLLRPAWWVGSHEPFRTMFGRDD